MCYSVFTLLGQASQIPTPDQTKPTCIGESAVIPSPPMPDSSTYLAESGSSTPTSGYGSSYCGNASPMSEGGATSPEGVPVEVLENRSYLDGGHFSPTTPQQNGYVQSPPNGYVQSPTNGYIQSPTNGYVQSPTTSEYQDGSYYSITESLQQQQPYRDHQQQQFFPNEPYCGGYGPYNSNNMFCYNYPQTCEDMNQKDPNNALQQQTICRVCGDTASGNHFGVQSCEACKSFFRRSIRANARYACRGNRSCAIEKHTRNRCQYCRLQKCVANGMRKEGERRLH